MHIRFAEQVFLLRFFFILCNRGFAEQNIHAAHQLGTIRLKIIQRTGSYKVLKQAFVKTDTCRAAGKIKNILKRTVFIALVDNRLHGLRADIANGLQGIKNFVAFNGETDFGTIDAGAAGYDIALGGILLEAVELFGAFKVQSHGSGNKGDRIIGFQPRRLIGDQRIGGCVRFVEAITGKAVNLVENLCRLIALHVKFNCTVDEARLLGIHFGFDLLTHGTAQQVGLAQRITRERLRDLHHLLLINHHPISLFKNGLQAVMHIIGFFFTLLAIDITRNIVHWPGAIQRHQRDNIFKLIRLHFTQHVTHARAFKLENANRIAAPQKLISLFVIKRQIIDVHLNAYALQQFNRLFQNGQGFQAQKVKLHQTGFFDPFHIELRYRHVGFWVTIKRNQLLQRSIPNHNTGCMR